MAFGAVRSGTGPDKCTCCCSERILQNLSKQACRSRRFGHFSLEVDCDLEALQQSLSAFHPLKFELSEVCRDFFWSMDTLIRCWEGYEDKAWRSDAEMGLEAAW